MRDITLSNSSTINRCGTKILLLLHRSQAYKTGTVPSSHTRAACTIIYNKGMVKLPSQLASGITKGKRDLFPTSTTLARKALQTPC
jgi:hypothetical protein